eukprot:TRINITY_DN10324_c0_g3_i1.p2 TRINITY_DN10324_c0_g3~~TRINITY_DN10324_c0_g3_i1.p2  ORF type:complete len:359 (-),score=57.06 TRINITY_DN10324_c0_g3_i1:155-1231(-)
MKSLQTGGSRWSVFRSRARVQQSWQNNQKQSPNKLFQSLCTYSPNYEEQIDQKLDTQQMEQISEHVEQLGKSWNVSPQLLGEMKQQKSLKKKQSDYVRFQPEFTLMDSHVYKRVLLKLSGEALAGPKGYGVDPLVLKRVATEVAYIREKCAVEVAVVVGGGNYFRGADAWDGLDRATADYVGMLATVMNAMQLQGALERCGVPTRVQTAIEMREIAEPYIRRKAIRHLEKGRVVIFGAGTGNPFFTTDTAAALRAAEIGADAFLKATKVDGVYDSDPTHNKDAKKYSQVSFREVQLQNLNVMDETAITLCKDNNIEVVVFNISQGDNIIKACQGKNIGTKVGHNCSQQQVDMEIKFDE